ncbi:MAG: magnesium/cobalt transporter CorA [Thermoflexales bacterium]|nr:magnesium/cobalt transporter CorA [Thermoflexales bacterium]MCS7324172.1 magnesium/cobalt transporter CorA [Thermoflexales bacterium]MCX7937935.1 magnesium/cobalt transporter CorA [Thermoflexales bacterium]MDW8053249.1 magnesium/cobalt transporter CorA [Anaerolineae bacterium]MDW8291900.1 magnesium/cobalt transporter CorA [Anaerolineae bacterium]
MTQRQRSTAQIRILQRAPDGTMQPRTEDGTPLLTLLAERGMLLWIDILDPSEGEDQVVSRLLREELRFHPLAVDDALDETHLPKVDDWGEYIYLVLHTVSFNPDLSHLHTRELDAFVGRNYLVTYHTEPIAVLERLWQSVQRDDRRSRRGADYLLYQLCDAIASDYMPCIDEIDAALDAIQSDVFTRFDTSLAERIFRLKSAVLALRRVLGPQREVLAKLARGDFTVIDFKERVYFRDVYDHFVRLTDLNETLRDLVSGTMDTYLSVVANHTNNVVKALTIVSLLFMPLTFITGFFGMNFFGASIELTFEAERWILFAAAVMVMFAFPIAMLLYIRHRGWW